MPYQWSGELPILPILPPVPIRTFYSRLSFLPNPYKLHDASNIFPKDIPDQAPINNNHCCLSNYTHVGSLIVEVAMVATQDNNTYNVQLWMLLPASYLYITPGYRLGMTLVNKK